MTILKVADHTTRASLAETITALNADAKLYSRQGRRGTSLPEYERLHGILNELLSDWERAPG